MDDWEGDPYDRGPRDRAAGRVLRRLFGRRPVRVSLTVTLLVVFGVLIWQGYEHRYRGDVGQVVPIILAEQGPMKIQPDDPGGYTVPHQDMSIYARIESSPDPGVRTAATTESSAAVQPRATEAGEAGNTTAEEARPHEAVSRQGEATRETPTRASETRGSRSQEAYEPPPRREYRTMAEAIGPYRIQMGSYGTPEAAYDRWMVLFRRHRDLLGNLDLIIEKVDPDDGPAVYRLQAGPLRTSDEVRGLCEQLHLRQVRCDLVEV